MILMYNEQNQLAGFITIEYNLTTDLTVDTSQGRDG
jgi:hypothetical protein